MTTTDAPQTNQITTARRPGARLGRVWAVATTTAVLLVTAAQLIAQAFADPLIVSGAGEVTRGNVIGFTVLGATIGAALAAGIGRFTRRPRSTFLAATLMALAGYAVVPFTAAESSSTALWLNLFHLIVAVPVIGMFARWLPSARTSVET
jgi:hypothetical protein